MTASRPAAVAGTFYPGDPETLTRQIRGLLAHHDARDRPVPKAIIAPHAGYVYSGAVAAAAYARLLPARHSITRVVLMGPCHRVAVRGLALTAADAFVTPLGSIPVDREAAALALTLPQVRVFDATHAQEHSLEVHLPFLQMVLERFAVVPFVVGDATTEEVAAVLDLLWGGDETLVVVSSDLSHYLDYQSARRLDADTCRAIESLKPEAIGRDQACGRVPVRGLLAAAAKRGLAVSTVGLCNSGDTAGDRSRVVGYGAWVFEHPARDRRVSDADAAQATDDHACAIRTQRLLDDHGATLLRLAAGAIRHGLANGGRPPVPNPDRFPAALRDDGACFVTLKRDERLRGCVGSYVARRPLLTDICEHACNAAFRDTRFKPLTTPELEGLELSVSVLSPQRPIAFDDEADLLDRLRPGIDGLVIQDGERRALFLPAVWRSLPRPADFLAELKRKAGMPCEGGSPDLRAWRFEAAEVSAATLGLPASLWTATAPTP